MKGWHAVVTQPKREDLAEEWLRRAAVEVELQADHIQRVGAVVGTVRERAPGFEVFAPTEDKWVPRRRNGRRPKRDQIKRPLFPGYLFVRFDAMVDAHWGRIFELPGVRGLLTVGENPARVPDDLIADLMDGKLPSPKFSVGDHVEPKMGAFAGFAARVADLDARGRVEVLLSLFGAERRVTVAPTDLRLKPGWTRASESV